MSVPGRAEGAVLQAAAAAPAIGIDGLAPPGGLLIVTPHPDDETLGCGMALAAAAASRRRIAIFLLTDGENSHPNSRQYPRARRIALRQGELRGALAALAPGHDIPIERAGLTDGDSTAEAAEPEFLDQACRFARRFSPAAVWTTWQGDPHCDHIAAMQIARIIAEDRACPLWSFPVWGRFGAGEVPAEMHSFDDPRFRKAKAEAIAGYRSQFTTLIDDDPDGFIMPAHLIDHFRNHAEIFIRE